MSNKLLVALLALSLAACSGGGGGGTGGGSGNAGGTGTAGSGTGGGARAGGSGNAGGSGTAGGSGMAGGRAGGSGTAGGSGNAGGTGTAGGSGATPGSSCTNPIILAGYTAPSITAELATSGQQIHYRLPVVANDMIQLATDTPTPMMGIRAPDTALTVFSTDGSQKLASMDDSFPRIFGTDTNLFYRATTTGTICIRLEEWQTWAGEAPDAGFPGDTITLFFNKMRQSFSFHTVDSELLDGGSNNTAATAQDAGWASLGTLRISDFIGGLDGTGDVDVFHLTTPPNAPDAGTGLALYTGAPLGEPLTSTSVGVNSYGSTLRNYAFRITTMAGVTIAAYTPPANPANMPEELDMVGEPSTDYLLWIERPAGAAVGTNDFYHSTYLYFPDDDAVEDPATDVANNTLATAAPFPLVQDATNAKLRAGNLLGKFNVAGADVDHFSFTHGGGDRVTLSCRAQRTGSGLRGAQFQFVTDAGTVESETETNDSDILWGQGGSKNAIITTDAGTMYLKVSGATQDAMNPANFYRCRVTVLAP